MKPNTNTFLIAAAVSATALAQEFHVGDVAINLDADRILIGQFDPDAPGSVAERQIFDAAFDSSGRTNDPGFDSPLGAFPAGSFGGLDVLSASRIFENGNFDRISPVQVGISFGPFFENVSPETDTESLGGYVGGVTSNGEFHNHFLFTLDPFNTGLAENGVYLLHLRMTFPAPVAAQSDEFWMLFGFNASAQEIGEAILAAESIFLPTDQLFSDFTTTGATLPGQPGYLQSDGSVDLDDLGVFLDLWLEPATLADVTTTGATLPGQPGFRQPDGQINPDDLGAYLDAWIVGE